MKKGLIVVLIAANLLMLVIGILTIPPNLRAAAGKKPPAPGTKLAAPITPPPAEEAPLTTPSPEEEDLLTTPPPEEEVSPSPTESGSTPALEETGVSLSTEERPDLEDFLWYTEDVVYDGVSDDVNIIDNIGPLIGSWKALIIYDPNNEYDSGAMEFLNITFASTAESLNISP